MLQDLTNSWKSFSASCWSGHGSIFPANCCQDAWSSGWLARGQVNMADEAKLRSPIHSIFKALVVWHVVEYCCGDELGIFCWPMSAARLQAPQFSVHSIGLLVYFSNAMVSQGFRKLQSIREAADHQRPWPFSGATLPLELLLQPLSWLSHKIPFSSHATIWLRNG